MTATDRLAAADPHHPELASRAEGLLATMNAAGVLAAVDVHVARTLGRLAAETDEDVLLAAALASRAPRLGHVRVELATIHATVTTEGPATGDLAALSWPPLERWLAALRASPLVSEGTAPSARPLRLSDGAVYLDRYWRHERLVGAEIRARAASADLAVEGPPPAGLPPDQAAAVATASRRALTVIAGGPGTGKTTTVARLLVLLGAEALAAGRPFPRIGLAAPTGKAANRVEASLRSAAAELLGEGAVRDWLDGLRAATIQRLLGSYGTGTRFRHDRGDPLPHDVVIVDEASMVAVSLMARLLEAVRPSARLIMVGDPDQLASVEAGAVLADVVAGALEPADEGGPLEPADTGAAQTTPGLRDAVVALRTVHRFDAGSGIAALSAAVRAGDADAAIRVLRAAHGDLDWLDLPEGGRGDAALDRVRADLVAIGAARASSAAKGDATGALASLDGLQLLTAHRRGPSGSRAWGARIGAWLGEQDPWGDGLAPRPLGTPLMVTANDYALGLFNGDIGVLVGMGGRTMGDERMVAFGPARQPRLVPESRLDAVEPVHAMTIHKSQGSEFDHVVAVLPDEGSRLLTRELLYTAVTRARRRLSLVAPEAALRAAIGRRVRRASGLRTELWGPGPSGTTSA